MIGIGSYICCLTLEGQLLFPLSKNLCRCTIMRANDTQADPYVLLNSSLSTSLILMKLIVGLYKAKM